MMLQRAILAGVIVCLGGAVSLQADVRQVPRDFPTIQAAIDAAQSGDEVIVSAGTYRESVRLKAGVTVRSAGDETRGERGLKRAEGTIIDGGGDAAVSAVTLAEGATFDGFSVTHVGKFDQQEYDRHYATRGEELPDERGAVGTGEDVTAISVTAVTAIVRNCIVHDNGHAGIGCAALADRSNNSVIEGNAVYRNMGGGIGVANGAAPLVVGNICFNNLRGGIGNRNSAGLILNNECYDNVRAGIGIREGAKPIVRGNRCYRNRRAGIGIRMPGTSPVVTDNDCYQNGMAGIGSRDGAAPVVRGNHCYENALAGIGTRDGASAHIVSNTCYKNKEAGIGTEGGARAYVAHNECYENEQAGIGQRGDAETTLEDNDIHHNKRAGIGFEDCTAGKSVVARNRIFDNALVAIGIHRGWNVRITDNEISRSGGLPPLVMVFAGSEADFARNTFTGVGVAGIRTEGMVRIVDNKFDCPTLRKAGPPQFAVWGLPGSNVTLLSNNISGWRQALQADKAAVIASNNQIRNFWKTGLRVSESPTPPVITDNEFYSPAGGQDVIISGKNGITENNRHFHSLEEKPSPSKPGA